MAKRCRTESPEDTAFGLVVGSVYMGFMQSCSTQYVTPNMDDMEEFYHIIHISEQQIRGAISDGIHHQK